VAAVAPSVAMGPRIGLSRLRRRSNRPVLRPPRRWLPSPRTAQAAPCCQADTSTTRGPGSAWEPAGLQLHGRLRRALWISFRSAGLRAPHWIVHWKRESIESLTPLLATCGFQWSEGCCCLLALVGGVL